MSKVAGMLGFLGPFSRGYKYETYKSRYTFKQRKAYGQYMREIRKRNAILLEKMLNKKD